MIAKGAASGRASTPMLATARGSGQSGAPVTWKNPDTGRYGTIVPGPAYQQASGTCRQYTHTIYIDGKPQTARGAACRNPDGTWTPIS